ncbi:hypothetical protein EV196_108244 [Mariniflexile fucanivorans]|uniref:Uncharacterized protein n=1 Tax=Mariniflexile fucanivorans TaxID=264023 RepID=A0A4R1RDT5_9FLAO|nr:hypothetical protein [Mariniflexile fucanivorans]TCL64044.1 hypothetical protein EV196_108244 [Mariniflexile fucanivorans]
MNKMLLLMESLSKTISSFFEKPYEEVIVDSLLKKNDVLRGGYVLKSKVHKYYGGGMSSDLENSLSCLISAKSIQEVKLDTKKKSFFEKLSEILIGSPDYEDVKKISQYSEKEILAILNDWDLDAYVRVQISQDFNEIRNSKRLVRTLEGRIKSILGNIRKNLRNYKDVFKRQHSFHFKNLDDYHSSILINKFELIKV